MSMTEIDTKFQGNFDRKTLGQVVLVFQGGGALGAYQAGVYEAMQEVGLEPDWVIGTSIGAINASLIAGSPPGRRLVQLQEFWRRIEQGPFHRMAAETWGVGSLGTSALTMATGVKGFFQPNLRALVGTKTALGAESAGYYSTAPLARTLADLIDPAYLNAGKPRLTVGAANVQSGEMHYFDSRKAPLTIRHVMASGALPPAFPAIRIDGELYWDGGILSNTPVEAVFDDNPRRSGLVFAVHIWNPSGPEPDSIWKVMSRQKDLQYASRAASHIVRQKQIHRLRHVIANAQQVRSAIAEDRAAQPGERPEPAAGRPVSILLVEDNALIRADTAFMLEDMGHAVAQAGKAAPALGKLQEQSFDLLLTDLGLPDMNGNDLAQKAVEMQPGLAVVSK